MSSVEEIGSNWPRTFNDLTARYTINAIGFLNTLGYATVTCVLQIFENVYREMCVCIRHSNGNDWHTPYDDWTAGKRRSEREREREKRKERKTRGLNGREEGGEGDHVKKSSSFVCQSFYDDTVVIRIYIHYRASECMTWMYLHFNSERACNLFCTIDLMMWLCS